MLSFFFFFFGYGGVSRDKVWPVAHPSTISPATVWNPVGIRSHLDLGGRHGIIRKLLQCVCSLLQLWPLREKNGHIHYDVSEPSQVFTTPAKSYPPDIQPHCDEKFIMKDSHALLTRNMVWRSSTSGCWQCHPKSRQLLTAAETVEK